MIRIRNVAHLVLSMATVMALAAGTARAAEQATAAVPTIALELNKLEATDKGCRAAVVLNNQTDIAYQTLKLDLVMFEGGVFTRRVALDLAPVRAQKRSVKLFDLDGIACDKISELLINDVIDCKTDAGTADNCLQRLTTSSLSNVKLSK